MNFITSLPESVRLFSQSFQGKLVLALLLPLVVIWSAVVYTSAAMLERQQDFVGNQQESAAALQADEFNEKLKDRMAILEADAAGLDISQLVTPHYAATYLAQRFALKSIFTAGTVIYDKSGTALGTYPAEERTGSNYADREFLKRLFATGQPTISKPYVGHLSSVELLTICVPIVGADRKVSGALCGNFDLRSINFLGRLSDSQYMGDNGFFLISTSDRILLASTDSNRVMSQLPDNTLVKQLLKGSGKAFVDKNITGVEKVYASAPVLSAGWVMALGLPTDIAYAPIRASVETLKRVALLASLLVVLASFYLARRLLTPLRQTVIKMDAMSSGRQALQHVEATGDIEVRNLLTSFNRLADSLASQQNQLQSERNALLLAKGELSQLNLELERGVTGAALDLIALKSSEQRVTQARNELLSIFDTLHEAVFVFDKHQEIIRVNPKGRTMHGLFDNDTPLAEVMAQVEMLDLNGDVVPQEQWPSHRAMRGDFVRDVEIHIRRRDTGASIYKEYSSLPILDESGELTMFVVTSRDITERRLHADLLRVSESKLRLSHASLEQSVQLRTADLVATNRKLAETQFAIDSVGIGIHWVDADSGHFLHVNEAASQMLGYSTEELVGLRVSDIDPNFPADGLHQALVELRQKGMGHFDSLNRTKDGRLFPVELTLYFLPEVADESPRFIVFVTDISMRRDSELALIQARKLAESATTAKSAFIANMSHEIRTPMHAILGLAYLLEKSALPGDAQHMVVKMRMAGTSLLGILNDVLDFSKIESGKLDIQSSIFRLSDVLDNLATIMSANGQEKDLELIISPTPLCTSKLIGDSLRLEQVLINLTGNAIKFTERGHVTLTISKVYEESDALGLRFSVSDSGIGIAQEKQGEIFEEFSQADGSTSRTYGGSGLGLTISHRLVAAMGGELMVDSAIGAGSEFWFELRFPRALDEWVAAPAVADLSVLIADNSSIAQEALSAIVGGLGWTATAVQSREEVLEHMASRTDKNRLYEVLLLDFKMPGRDGLQVAETVCSGLKNHADPIVILVTPSISHALLNHPQARLADAILTKPVTSTALYNAVALAMRVRRGGEPQRRVLNTLRLSGLRMLVVDDSGINREVAQGIFSHEGAVVALANDGQEAVDWLQAPGNAVDLVLMDVQMPVLNGYEATRQVRCIPLLANLPIIALTAGAFQDQQELANQSGMTGFLAKPFDVETAIALIVKLTGHVAIAPMQEVLALPYSPPSLAENLPGIALSKALAAWLDAVNYQKFLRQFAARYANIVQELRAISPAAALALAHKFRGAAGSLALEDVAVAALALEHLWHQGEAPEQALIALQEAMEIVLGSIARYAPLPAPTQSPSGVQNLLAESWLARLLAAWQSDSSSKVAGVLAGIGQSITPSSRELLQKALDNYDFRLGEAATEQLIQAQPSN